MTINVIEVTGEPILHGGQECFISNIIEYLDEPEITIDVITPYQCDNKAFCELVRSHGGEVYSLNMAFNPGKSRRAIRKPISEFLRTHHYDIIHIHSGSISVLAYIAEVARKAGIKNRIVHSHCTSIPSLKHSAIKTLFAHKISKNATTFVACSYDAGKDKYAKTIVDQKLIIIRNGIQVELFQHNEEKRMQIRNELGVSPDDYVIGHVGRFSHQKNHNYLVEVFKMLHQEIPNSDLLMIGDGELKDDVEKAINDYNLEDNSFFIGNVDNVYDYYQAMDLFMFPSRYEGFGYVALEAQAAGLPCLISTEVPKDVVICDNVERISLDDKDMWLTKAIEYRNVSSNMNHERIKAAGYSIRETINQIRVLYLSGR